MNGKKTITIKMDWQSEDRPITDRELHSLPKIGLDMLDITDYIETDTEGVLQHQFYDNAVAYCEYIITIENN